MQDKTYLQQTAPAFSWVQPVVDATVQTWSGVFAAERTVFRTTAMPLLDVRRVEQPESAWIFANLPVVLNVAQVWPAMLAATQGFRTGAAPSLDVRKYEWSPELGWLPTAADGAIATWQPAFANELASYRSAGQPRLDVRRYEWSPESGWTQPAADAVIAAWQSAFATELASYRSGGQPLLDTRRGDQPQAAWIFANLPAAPPPVVGQSPAAARYRWGFHDSTVYR